MTLLEHYQQVARQTKKRPPELNVPERPPELEHVWSVYKVLRRGTPADEAVLFQEIVAYTALIGVDLLPEEVDAIRALDVVWLEVRNG